MDDPTIVPPAQRQSSIPPENQINSGTAGVIVERTAQLKNEYRSAGRKFARMIAEYINTKQVGLASVYVYEETFGTKDKVHWLIHLSSLEVYEKLVQMGTQSEEYRSTLNEPHISPEADDSGWDKIFLDGSFHETVLLPQFWGMYGTKADGQLEKQTHVYLQDTPVTALPGARQQVALPSDQILHSGNAGIILHRSAIVDYDFRSEGRKFAREVAESINENLADQATVFVYEEAFGVADRIHWLIHLKSLTSYYRLLELHVKNEKVRNLYFDERIPRERGGGTWARMFLPGSMVDVALTPHHWGIYAT